MATLILRQLHHAAAARFDVPATLSHHIRFPRQGGHRKDIVAARRAFVVAALLHPEITARAIAHYLLVPVGRVHEIAREAAPRYDTDPAYRRAIHSLTPA